MTHGCARRMRSVGAGSRQSVAQAQLTIAQAQWSAMSAIDAALGALATHKSSNNNSLCGQPLLCCAAHSFAQIAGR